MCLPADPIAKGLGLQKQVGHVMDPLGIARKDPVGRALGINKPASAPASPSTTTNSQGGSLL